MDVLFLTRLLPAADADLRHMEPFGRRDTF